MSKIKGKRSKIVPVEIKGVVNICKKKIID